MEESKFLKLFADQLLEETEIELEMSTMFRELESWDSMTAMAVIVMIEDEYNIQVPDEEFRKFITLRDIFTYIHKERQ